MKLHNIIQTECGFRLKLIESLIISINHHIKINSLYSYFVY